MRHRSAGPILRSIVVPAQQSGVASPVRPPTLKTILLTVEAYPPDWLPNPTASRTLRIFGIVARGVRLRHSESARSLKRLAQKILHASKLAPSASLTRSHLESELRTCPRNQRWVQQREHTMQTIQNPNHPQYWIDVKERALYRRTLTKTKSELQHIKPSLIYEVWVCDIMGIIMSNARVTALILCPEMFALYMQTLSDEFGLPEIITYSEQDFADFASEARDEARSDLYG